MEKRQIPKINSVLGALRNANPTNNDGTENDRTDLIPISIHLIRNDGSKGTEGSDWTLWGRWNRQWMIEGVCVLNVIKYSTEED